MSLDTDLELESEEEEEDYMPTFEHAILESQLNAALTDHVRANKLGRVAGSSAEYRFLKQGSGGRQPDLSFVRQERLPARFRSYPDVPPDLAIEIESPSDKPYETQAKIAEYQKAGVRLVWVVHPYTRSIDVYHIDTGIRAKILYLEDELTGDDVVPGFRLPLKDLFDYPADPDPVPDPKPQKTTGQRGQRTQP